MSGRGTGLVGQSWAVVRIADRYGSTAVPAGLHARIGYTRDGYVLGDDGMNALQGHYVDRPGGYVVRNAITSLVGGSGGVTVASRTAAAVDDTFFAAGGGNTVQVSVEFHGGTLVLRTAGLTLTLRAAGAEPDFGSATTFPTPTRTG